MSKYIPIDFAPRVFSAWSKIFKTLTVEERSEILLGIAEYPEYEPKAVALWSFFKGELDRQFEKHQEYSKKQSERRRKTVVDHGQPRMTTDDHGQPRSTIREKIEDRREKVEECMPSPSSSASLVNQVLDIYNDVCKDAFAKAIKLTEKRKKAAKTWIRFYKEQTQEKDDTEFLERVKEYFSRAANSDFLRGLTGGNWKADFDFLINVNNSVKVLEGKYDNRDTNDSEKESFFAVPPDQKQPDHPPEGWTNPYDPVPDDSDYKTMDIMGMFRRASK